MGEEQQQNNVKSINIYEVNLDRNWEEIDVETKHFKY